MKNKWIRLGLIDLLKFGGGGLSPTPALSFALPFLIIEKLQKSSSLFIVFLDWRHLVECPSAKFTWREQSDMECYDERNKQESGKNLILIKHQYI